MGTAKKFVFTIAADYEGQSELKELQADLKSIGQIDSFEKLRGSWQKTNAQFVEAKAKVRELYTALKNGGGKDIEKQYAAAGKEVKRLSASLARQKGQLDASRTAIQQSGIAIRDLSTAYDKLKSSSVSQGHLMAAQMKLGVRSIKSVESEIAGLKRAYDTLESSGTQSVRELAVAKDRLRTKVAALRQETNGWASHLSQIQVGWAGLLGVAGSVAAASRGIKFFAGFDDSMREVQAFTDAGEQEMLKFSDLAQNLGATTRFTASEVAQGMAELTQSGIKSYQELSGVIPSITSLTSASGMQFKESADLLTDTMKQFRLETTEAAHVTDVIVKGYTSAGHSAHQLGEALSYVGPVAKQLDYSLESTVAILDALAESGYKGQRGGVALRGGFTRLINPVGEAVDVLDKYNILIEDSEGRTRDFADIIEDLGAASLSSREMMQLFGQEAGPAMMALVGQGGDAIRDFQRLMEDADGTAAKIAATMESGIGGSLRSLSSGLQAVVISFGDSLAPAIKATADVVTLLARGLSYLPKPLLILGGLSGTVATGIAAWHLGLKHLHSAMALASVDFIRFAKSTKAISIALSSGISKTAIAIAVANPALAAMAVALGVGATAWAVFGKSSLESSREHAESAEKIGEARKAIDDEIDHLEKLQKVLTTTAEGTARHADAEAELANILPDANLSLDEQGRIMARVGDETGNNSEKLREYIDLKKEESRNQFALQIEQQAKAYFKAGEAVEGNKDNLVQWYGIGQKSTTLVQDFWRGLNRLTGTYERNIQKGSEMRTNLNSQKIGYESLLRSLLKTGATTDQVNEMLSRIHMDEGTKGKVLSQYKAMFDGIAKSGEQSAEAVQKANADSMKDQVETTKENLKEMKAAYDSYADQVKSIQKEIADREQSASEKIRAIRREGMSDLGAWKDRKKEAYEYEEAAKSAAQAAEDAMANGDTEAGNALFKQAVEYADKAKAAYADLNGEVKEGDKILISSDKARKTSIAGIEDASRLAIDILKQQEVAAQSAMDALNLESDVDLSRPIDDAIAKLDEIIKSGEKMENDLKKNIDEFGVEAGKVIDEIDEKIAKPRTMKIAVEQSQASRLGGLIGSIQALRLGGAVMMAGGGALGNALKGYHFPGYGGGDRRHVIAEDGEVMIRKESVKSAGLRAALAFNAGNWRVVIAELMKRFSIKMQHGGPVGRFSLPPLPAIPMQVGGAVAAGAGGGDSVTIHLYDHATQEKATLIAPTKNDYGKAERILRRNERLSGK